LTRAPRSLRLAFAGTPPFAVPPLDALHAAGHEIRMVFTQADRPAGRGQTVQPSAVKQRALELGLPVLQPATFKSEEAQGALRGLDLDALVVVAYGLILPPAALAIPRLGCINIHASLLPRWRGAAPIQRAILAGDAATGITIMRMEAGLDTGPMLAQRALLVAADETTRRLQERLSALGAELVCEVLADMTAGTIEPKPQPDSGVTYAAKISKAEALIDWRDEAAAIARKVRAFDPWPIAETRFQGKQLRIWEAEALPAPAGASGSAPSGGASSGGAAPGAGVEVAAAGSVLAVAALGIDVACGHGVLRLKRLQQPGRKPVSALEFANALPLAGARFANA
jgi:methionyl-tRNA formyltransferase